MFSALLSFLGGSAFRLVWEQISSFVTARQDHEHEIARMRLQAVLDASAFERSQAAIRLQAELGVKTIAVQSEADVARIETEGWAAAIAASAKPTGVFFVDVWNGIVRPCAATVALGLWVAALWGQGWKMTDWDLQLVGVILGYYFASRAIFVAGRK